MNLISSEATTALGPHRLLKQQCQGEIVLHPAADGGQKPETAVQGLHLLSLVMYMGTLLTSWQLYFQVIDADYFSQQEGFIEHQ